ncbi:MAG: GAF and ANTAR domain-containing protein [Micromonosporaceae bacterium]
MAGMDDHGRSVDPLARVCEVCVGLVPVDGASIAVASDATIGEILYASDYVIRHAEAAQFTLGEGPCVEALKLGHAVLVPDISETSASAWPAFTTELADQPLGAIFAFPLQSGAIDIGVLAMYRRQPSWFSIPELETVLQLADLAALALLRSGHDQEWLTSLPRDRVKVHQATGMLTAQLGVPADQALIRLRGHAFATGRLVEDVARDILDHRIQLEDTSG